MGTNRQGKQNGLPIEREGREGTTSSKKESRFEVFLLLIKKGKEEGDVTMREKVKSIKEFKYFMLEV